MHAREVGYRAARRALQGLAARLAAAAPGNAALSRDEALSAVVRLAHDLEVAERLPVVRAALALLANSMAHLRHAPLGDPPCPACSPSRSP